MIEIKDGEIAKDSGSRKTPALGTAPEIPDLANGTAPGALFSGLGESLRMATRALKANIFRTVLTLLGIVIGVGSVVAMLAIGDGAKQAWCSRSAPWAPTFWSSGRNSTMPAGADLSRR